MAIRTAVIPAAGMGTRFLPATKAVPKELMPIFDTPAIQLVMDEAIGAGATRIVIVTSPNKPAIEQYVQPSDEVVKRVRDTGRVDLAARLERIGRDVEVVFALQSEPKGLGHAVSCAHEQVGNEPFMLLLPDELMGGPALLSQMVAMCERDDKSVVGLKQVPMSEVASYGVVTTTSAPSATGEVTVTGVVEKPKPEESPSDLILIGRYVLMPEMFDLLAGLKPAASGEIQLTDALLLGANERKVLGVVSDIDRYDTGTPLGWLKAVIEFARQREDVAPSLDAWLLSLFD
ncbi:MAG: UTP--glucose-phosphate uridylyltransferase [Actinomycetota bacterium]